MLGTGRGFVEWRTHCRHGLGTCTNFGLCRVSKRSRGNDDSSFKAAKRLGTECPARWSRWRVASGAFWASGEFAPRVPVVWRPRDRPSAGFRGGRRRAVDGGVSRVSGDVCRRALAFFLASLTHCRHADSDVGLHAKSRRCPGVEPPRGCFRSVRGLPSGDWRSLMCTRRLVFWPRTRIVGLPRRAASAPHVLTAAETNLYFRTSTCV